MYIGRSDSWLKDIKPTESITKIGSISISISTNNGVDADVWIRDASLGTLGDIGEAKAELVKDAVMPIVSCLGLREAYTRKRAVVALYQIASNDVTLITPYESRIEKVLKSEKDEKVKKAILDLLNRIKNVENMV